MLANGRQKWSESCFPTCTIILLSDLNKILEPIEFGFKFLVFNGDHNEEVERRYLQELMAYKVEGMMS